MQEDNRASNYLQSQKEINMNICIVGEHGILPSRTWSCKYHVMVLFSPQMIAAAAFYSARFILDRFQYWTPHLHNLSGYSKEEIKYFTYVKC